MKSKLSPAQITAIIIAALGSILVAHYDEFLPYHWETYTAPDGTFSVELPGKPQAETTQVPLEGGGTAIAHFIIAKPKDNTAYSCAYTEHENINDKTPDQLLDSARDGSLRKIQGTVQSQKRITAQGHPGLEMQASARNNSLLDARLLVVGDRLYMIMAVATARTRDAKSVQRMFDSFKLK